MTVEPRTNYPATSEDAPASTQSASPMPFRFEFHVKTDVGTQRTRNEDSYLIASEFALSVVADGMGGHVGGDIASDLATSTIREHFDTEFERNRKKSNRRRDGDFLRKAISLANHRVYTEGSTNDELRDMGTTIVVAWFREDYVVAGSVGDSRIYRIRDHKITQVSVDHSWVGELRRRRLISDEEAQHHPLKNIITRALGMDKKVVVDIFLEDLKAGDIYLLCTDGLTDFVEDSRIRDIIEDNRDDLSRACEKLIEMANFIAGADNTTIAITEVLDANAPSKSHPTNGQS